MPALTLQQADAPASSGGSVPGPAFARRRRRTLKRVVLSVFALAWIAGCILVLTHVFAAVRTKCVGCPECLGAP
jgi:hypothetical protein